MIDRPDSVACLTRRAAEGDDSSFDSLVRLYRRDLYKVAYRVLGSHEDADEAVQEAFVRAWRSMKSFRGDSAVKTWLTRIVINTSRTIVSRRKETGRLDDAAPVADSRPQADSAAALGQVRSNVRKAVSQLPPRQREVVWLKIFSELRYQDVAEAMGLSVGAVKAHLHQAVSNLRRRMNDGLLDV